MRIIQGINPNCSEFIVRLHTPKVEELKEILDYVIDNDIGVVASRSSYSILPEFIDKTDNIALAVKGENNRVSEPDDIYVINGYGYGGSKGDKAIVAWYPENYNIGIICVGDKPNLRDADTLNIYAEGNQMVASNINMMCSDYDKVCYPVIAEIVRRFNLYYSGYDGGSSKPFVKWCEENGYQDVADKSI